MIRVFLLRRKRGIDNIEENALLKQTNKKINCKERLLDRLLKILRETISSQKV